MTASSYLPIAVRAYTTSDEGKRTKWRPIAQVESWSKLTLVFDCETRTDTSQRLTFGGYRVYDGTKLVDEGIFYGDDLDEEARELLTCYCRAHREGDIARGEPLRLLSRAEFLEQVFYRVAWRGSGAVVGFNLPFDLSRLATEWRIARRRPYTGGFSFIMLEHSDEEGRRYPHPFRPRIAVKSINSKEALIGFTSNWHDTDPRERQTRRSKSSWRGHFLDCRTLTYALTGESETLASACKRFGVEHGKLSIREHGKITSEYIDYARRDVLATWELYRKLLAEFERHPIDLLPSRAYSVAAIGKAYLKAMGVRLPQVGANRALHLSQREIFGRAMASYYGGRAECRVRMTPVPVVYCDFLSMYPTVNSLMHLWDYLTAERVAVQEATEQVQAFLEQVTIDDLFKRSTWQNLAALVEVIPDEDIFPVRARYSRAPDGDYTTGVNHITSNRVLCFTLADCIASKLLTGKAPHVHRALRFRASKKQKGLQPLKLRGVIPIDPAHDDFFKRVIEERQKIKSGSSADLTERERLEHFLKLLANSTSYGILIELNRQAAKETSVDVFGLESYSCSVQHVEKAGAYFFPVLGTLITGAARLMLALAEVEIERRGGTYAFMDTDSVAIVATESGGLVACQGGSERLPDGRAAIRALKWSEVEAIRERFAQLNPYDHEQVPGSILKLEAENFADNDQRAQKELWCYVIAAKRYALFNRDRKEITLRKSSEHGLGQYLPPENLPSGEAVTDWIAQAWQQILGTELESRPTSDADWMEQLARTRLAISTPEMLKWFAPFTVKRPRSNIVQKSYAEAVKPFNFFEHAPLQPLGRPSHVSKDEPFCLITPSASQSGTCSRWINIHNPAGPSYRVLLNQNNGVYATDCLGSSYGDLIDAHPRHSEPKSCEASGKICHPQTKGVLGRRHIQVAEVLHIGKEANDFEIVQAGLVSDSNVVQTTYPSNQWETLRAIVAEMPASRLQRETHYSRRQVYYLRSGRRCPAKKRLPVLFACAAKYARERLALRGDPQIPDDDMQTVALYAMILKSIPQSVKTGKS